MSDPLIYSDKLAVSAYSADSEASGYEASQLGKIAVGHEWRSATTGSTVTVIFDLGSAKTVRAIHLNRVNFASATVKRGASSPPGTTVGTIESAVDRRGIRRATLAVNASSRYWSVEIASGTPTDGEAFWRAGSAFLWGSVDNFPGFRVGSTVGHNQGGEEQTTPRRDRIVNTTGPVRGRYSATILALRDNNKAGLLERLAQAGIVLVDPGIGDEFLFPSQSFALETALELTARTEQAGVEIEERC